MDNLIKDNKCKRSIIRGTEHIDSISAGETKVITISFTEDLSNDAVCITSAVGWALESSVQYIDTNAVIVSVTNQSETGVSDVDLNYVVL